MKICRKQIGTLSHYDRHGFASARITVPIYFRCVDVILLQKIFHQCNRLICRSFSPVVKLRRNNNHLVIVLLCLKSKFLRLDIGSDSLKIQPFITGQRKIQGIRLTAIIAFRNIYIVMNIPCICGMVHIVNHKIPVDFRSFRDIGAFIRFQSSIRYIRF